ncbi:hypothetical protein ACFPM3_04965 [Streptomyces coeruleoprunus]|uniref:SAM-dependent methyltransferase n=1 Tax=Streptomyces coeruleoprunus TaxID=285563 RepID=A0ABV9X907_9ACTN
MKTSSEHEAAIVRLWDEHLHAAFPARLRGAEGVLTSTTDTALTD